MKAQVLRETTMALNAVGIAVGELETELILETLSAYDGLGDQFSLKDAAVLKTMYQNKVESKKE